MTDDPRTRLLSAAGGDDTAHTALVVLRHALEWSASAIAAAPVSDDDGLALELVVALDDALAQAEDLLAHGPGLIESSVAGVAVAEFLEAQLDRLAELADRVAVARRERDALAEVSAELAASGAEHERVVARLAELRRLQRLADALPELVAEQERISRRVTAMTSKTAEAEQALAETASTAVSLAAERLADLESRSREVLTTLRQTESAWAQLRAQLAADEATLRAKDLEYTKLKAERAERVAAMRAHAAIDADLADRLADAKEGALPDRVRTRLVEAQTVIDEVDAALGDALHRYDQFVDAYHKVLPWREDS